MIYLTTALFEEASAFIQYLELKKDNSLLPFDVYRRENIFLLITGVRGIRSAIALSHLLTLFPPSEKDVFLSFGTAACENDRVSTGSVFRIHKITDTVTGFTMYPELLFSCPFSEASVFAVPSVRIADEKPDTPYIRSDGTGEMAPDYPPVSLYDMESAAIYETCSTYLDTHQFHFLRMVSDHMSQSELSDIVRMKDSIRKNAEAVVPTICRWLEGMLSLLPPKPAFTEDDRKFLLYLTDYLKCSVSMQNSLCQLILYLKQNRDDYRSLITQKLHSVTETACHTRKEGKDVLARLKDSCL